MFPSRALAYALFVPTALSLATVFLPSLLTLVLAVDGLIGLIALLDYVLTKSARVEASVWGRDILSIGQNNVVELSLTMRDRALLNVEVRPDLPQEISCAELAESRSLGAQLARHRTTELK